MKALHDAGVEILTGTDAGNFGVFLGYSVHRELALFVEAGLTPWAALRAGSTRAKSVLDLDLGVHPGAEASFLLLEDSPITDIRNTYGVHMVIHKGVVVDREALLQR